MIAILIGAYCVAGIATAIITIDRWAWAGRSWRSIVRPRMRYRRALADRGARGDERP